MRIENSVENISSMLFEEFFYDRTKAISLSGFCVHNYFKLVSCLSGTLAVDFMNGAFRTTEVKEHWGLLMNISRIIVTPFSQETNPLLFYNGSLSYFFLFSAFIWAFAIHEVGIITLLWSRKYI